MTKYQRLVNKYKKSALTVRKLGEIKLWEFRDEIWPEYVMELLMAIPELSAEQQVTLMSLKQLLDEIISSQESYFSRQRNTGW